MDRIVQLICLIIYAIPLMRRKIYGYEYKMIKLLYLYVFIVLSISILHLSFDFYWLPYSLNIILYIPIGYVLYLIYNQYTSVYSIPRYDVISFIFDSIIIANIVQICFSFLFFANPNFLETYLSYVKLTDLAQVAMGNMNVRMIGVGQAFFSGVLNYSFVLTVLTLLPTLNYSIIYKHKITYYVIFLFTALAAILTGRTSFITLSLLLTFSLFYYKIKFSSLFPILISGLFIFYFLFEFLLEYFELDRLNKIYNWAFEMFISGSNGLESTSSSTILLRMLNKGINLESIILGDGYFLSNGGYYMHTDVGYYRFIYFGGIIWIIFLFYYYFIINRVLPLNKIKTLNLMFILLSILFLIFNIKGVAMYDHFILLFIFPAYLYSYKSDKKQVL